VGATYGDEELGAVGVLAGVGHGEEERAVVLEGKVLVGELLTVDGLATSSLLSLAPCVIPQWPAVLTFWRVKSPPWSMKRGMTRWKGEPA
jgi:hypothetical protein